MKIFFISLATLAIALTSCQKNETFNKGIDQKDGEIKFGVIASKTKATQFGSTSDFLTDNQKFNVVGRFADGTYYLGSDSNAVEITYNKATNEWTYTGVRFWPDLLSLDFFAWKDGKTGTATPTFSSIGSNTMLFNNYTVSNQVADQQDLLVAADTYKKPTLARQTVLTFKHALTQVVFSAQLYVDALHPASSISVEIDEVAIVNVANTGDLTISPFGYAAADNYPAGGNENDPIDGRAVMNDSIAWSNQSNSSIFAVTGLNASVTALSTNLVGTNLTPLTNNTDNAMLMIPQTFNAWDNSKSIADGGAYIRVKALIKDINAGTVLWGTAGVSKDLYIPISSQTGMYGEWVWGRKINYVIVFGDPNSGSGGGGWGGNGGDPVLVPIRLEAQLTDWDTYDVYLQKVSFNSTVANVQGSVDQFITEINNNPAKKYTANFNITGNATALDMKWTNAVADKCNVGSKITIDLTSVLDGDMPADDTNFKPTIVLSGGYSWNLTESGKVYVYVLTKD